MKKCLLLTILILAVSLLCGCSDKNAIRFEKLESESSEASIEGSSTTVEEVVFTAEIASESFLSSTKNYHSYKTDGDGYISVLYKTKTTVSNVELFNITLNDEAKGVKGETVFTLEKLSPDKHLVASTLMLGAVPQMAISFTDANGTIYTYSVNTSGKDGSIVLTELELVEDTTESSSKSN